MALAISPAQSEDPAMQAPLRIAMWSGPRNISTAMMRAWGNRPDTFVVDEPFYAFYLKKNREPTVEDLGFVQQAEIFDFVHRQINSVPPVIDADDVLRDPQRMLRLLCDTVGVDFTKAMLSWPSGRRESDGIWAKYWYAEVECSSSFAPYRERKVELPQGLHEVHVRCREIYERLYKVRLR